MLEDSEFQGFALLVCLIVAAGSFISIQFREVFTKSSSSVIKEAKEVQVDPDTKKTEEEHFIASEQASSVKSRFFSEVDQSETLICQQPSVRIFQSAPDDCSFDVSDDRCRKVFIVRNQLPLQFYRDATGVLKARLKNSLDILVPLKQLEEHFPTRPVFVGHPGISVLPEEKESFSAMLWEQHRCIPIYPSDETFKLHHDGFCRRTLWPLFHYIATQTGYKRFNREEWQAFTAVNNMFARVIASYVEESDFVWINGYHLFLVPSLLRKKVPHVRIGVFVHTPWPSSELFRTLPVRKDILQGVLNADLVGFHTFDYARHFLSSCRRLLDLDLCATSHTHIGLCVKYCGRAVAVRCLPGGINTHAIVEVVISNPCRVRIREETQRAAGRRIIIGIDELTTLNGIANKLQVLSDYLDERKEEASKIRLVQFVYPSHTIGCDKSLKDSISSICEAFDKKFPDVLDFRFSPQRPSDEELFAVMRIADILFITALWDGLNLLPYIYITCQQASKVALTKTDFDDSASESSALSLDDPRGSMSLSTPESPIRVSTPAPSDAPEGQKATRKNSHPDSVRNGERSATSGTISGSIEAAGCPTSSISASDGRPEKRTEPNPGGRMLDHVGVVVCSEFSGCSRSLSSMIRVNPWNVEDMKEGLCSALEMSLEDRRVRLRRQFRYILKHTVFTWAISFLKDLDHVCDVQKHMTPIDVGWGLGSRVFYFASGFKRLTLDNIVYKYRNAQSRLLLFDYDGTLVPISDESVDATRQAPPPRQTINALQALVADPRNSVFVLTGQMRKYLDRWFSKVRGLGLAAEHGFAYKLPHDYDWRIRFSEGDLSWKHVAIEVLESYTERTDGSFIETKESGLVWHYENADVDFGSWQAKELAEHLSRALVDENVNVSHLDGNKTVEVEPRGVSKGKMVNIFMRGQDGYESASSVDSDEGEVDGSMTSPFPSGGVTFDRMTPSPVGPCGFTPHSTPRRIMGSNSTGSSSGDTPVLASENAHMEGRGASGVESIANALFLGLWKVGKALSPEQKTRSVPQKSSLYQRRSRSSRSLPDELDEAEGQEGRSLRTDIPSMRREFRPASPSVSLESIDFVLCIGNDSSDEEMFAAVKKMWRGAKGVEVFTCTVGQKPSEADYYCADQSEVNEIVEALANTSRFQKDEKRRELLTLDRRPGSRGFSDRRSRSAERRRSVAF